MEGCQRNPLNRPAYPGERIIGSRQRACSVQEPEQPWLKEDMDDTHESIHKGYACPVMDGQNLPQ